MIRFIHQWSKKFVKEQTEDNDELIEDEGQDMNCLCFFKLNDSENLQYNMPIVEL